jgi:hypothetical protein
MKARVILQLTIELQSTPLYWMAEDLADHRAHDRAHDLCRDLFLGSE